jgi:hypothetical protein
MAATSKLSRAAKDAMKVWKQKNGIRAIVPKSDNQKIEAKMAARAARSRERIELKKIKLGAASEVRHLVIDK